MNTYAAHLIDVAHAAYRAGRHAEAEATLRLALGQGTRDPWIVYFIGHLCYLQGRLEEARQYLAHSLQLDPDNARAHNDLGETLCGLGRQAEAVPHFERSIALEEKRELATRHQESRTIMRLRTAILRCCNGMASCFSAAGR